MRWTLVLPAAAIIAMAFLALLLLSGDEGATSTDPEAAAWHQASSVAFEMGFCGDCHYGMEEMWNTQWAQGEDAWDLVVAPRFAEAPLYGVQVVPNGTAPVAGQPVAATAQMAWGETLTETLTVPEGATGILARFHGAPPEGYPAPLGPTYNNPNDHVTTLALVAPDGTRFEADGPEPDLKILVLAGADVVPGDWTVEAAITAGESPVATGVLRAEALAGTVMPHLATLADAWNTSHPAGEGGAPPAVTLRLWPYHQHQAFENTDWDSMDSTPFSVTYTPTPGPAPPPSTWNETAIDALWAGETERVVLDRTGSRQNVYVQEPGHNDPGLGGSYPSFGPLGEPVWPGTTLARFELTWEPPLDLPQFQLRFSPAHTVYFFEPEEVERGPGRALFEMAVQPAWWEEPDQVLAWLDPDKVTSYWDMAPYWNGAEGEAQVEASEWRLVVTTVREG